MRPLPRLALALLLACAALSGCAPKAGVVSETTADAEDLVKPEPGKAPPAAAPPALPTPEAQPPQAAAPSATPEAQTKETLEPKVTPSASLPQPKSRSADSPSPPKAGPQETPAGQAKAAGPSVAVVGDSLAVGIGMTMAERLRGYEGMGCQPLGKISTGLISKKFYDWEKRLSELVATEKLAAVVVMLGGNDADNRIAGKAAGTPEWDAAYRQKAESFLRIAASSGVRVLWVGLPAMRDPEYNKRVAAVNAAAKKACAAVPGCAYMEASDLFTDASGNYVQAKDINGRTVTLRGKDGVHMTMTGYDLLCRQVLDRLAAEGALR